MIPEVKMEKLYSLIEIPKIEFRSFRDCFYVHDAE